MCDSITTIEESAFAGCRRLRYVKLSESLTNISYALFDGCAFEDIYFPPSVTRIGGYAFTSCNFKELEIPNTITSIGGGAFRNCKNLTRVVIPHSVTALWAFTFDYCTALEEIFIGDGVEFIDYGALNECNALKTITLGASIGAIKKSTNWPLGSCKNLTRLYNRRPDPISIDEAVLQQVDYDNCILYVPIGSAHLYRNAPVWGRFVHIKEFNLNVPTAVVGDVNLDGEVNIADVNDLVELIQNPELATVDIDTDINQDGEINISDINCIIGIILGRPFEISPQ